MGLTMATRCTALALIIGPVLALAFFLLLPGGLFISPASATDVAASIDALESNSTLARAVAIGVPLGLIIMLFGIKGYRVTAGSGERGDTLTDFGFLSAAVGFTCWIVSYGMVVVIAGPLGVEGQADVVFRLDTGISLIGSFLTALGLLSYSWGIALNATEKLDRIAAQVVAGISAVFLLTTIIGALLPDQIETTTLIGRACYFPIVCWCVALGVGMINRRASIAAESAMAEEPEG